MVMAIYFAAGVICIVIGLVFAVGLESDWFKNRPIMRFLSILLLIAGYLLIKVCEKL